MKKWFCFILLLLPILGLYGCGDVDAELMMSEQTRIFFCGRGEKSECSLSVGEREDPYIIDGKHGSNTAFSLVVVKPASVLEVSEIAIELEIDGQKQSVNLELNPLNMTYIADLGYSIRENSSLKVFCLSEQYTINNISNSFSLQCADAIKLGMKEVKNDGFFDERQEEYECYLKIVEGEKFGQKGYFWCFSVITQNKESKNVLVSTQTGEIILG